MKIAICLLSFIGFIFAGSADPMDQMEEAEERGAHNLEKNMDRKIEVREKAAENESHFSEKTMDTNIRRTEEINERKAQIEEQEDTDNIAAPVVEQQIENNNLMIPSQTENVLEEDLRLQQAPPPDFI